MRRSILTEKIARRGHHITREYSIDLFNLMRVGEVMDSNAPTVPADATITRFAELIAQGDPRFARHQGTLIVDDAGRLVGIITRGDIVRALQGSSSRNVTVLDAGKRNPIVTYPDEPLNDAIHKMLHNNIGRLPVVSRDDSGKILGYFGRANVVSARARHIEEEHVRERGGVVAA